MAIYDELFLNFIFWDISAFTGIDFGLGFGLLMQVVTRILEQIWTNGLLNWLF